MNPVIAIDGPAASGKSTVAREVAKKLGYVHVNSGALYRAVGCEAVSRGIPLDDEDGLCRVARGLTFNFQLNEKGETTVTVNGEDRSTLLSSQQAGEAASRIAVYPRLREILNAVQRKAAESGPLVLEGRDAGSIVFPDAPFKFFLDASAEVRARRRFEELKVRGEATTLAEVSAALAERDRRDATRVVAPQVVAKDAFVIETNALSGSEVVGRIIGRISGDIRQ